MNKNTIKKRNLLLLIISFLFAVSGALTTNIYAESKPSITPNFVDADIRDVINTVSELTGKNFILDQTINFKVNITSATPMTYDEFYNTFLTTLQVHGYIAVPSGKAIKLIQENRMRQEPVQTVYSSKTSNETYVTRVFDLKHVSNTALNQSIRPIVSTSGHFVNIGTDKVLVIDRAANVKRIGYILKQIDRPTTDDAEMITLQHASASEMVRILTSLFQARQAGQNAAGSPVSFIADERTNSVIISSDENRRTKIRTLVASLDAPLPDDNGPQVIYLKYADAETLAQILKEQSSQNENYSIIPDVENNALVITAPPKKLRSIRSVIDKLDIRRAQVQVEAMIVEVNADKSASLGITWAFDGSSSNNGSGLTNFPSAATGVAQIGGLLQL